MRPRSPWLRRIPVLIAVSAAIGWLPYQLWGRAGLGQLFKLRRDVARLRVENSSLRERNRALRVELGLYEDDDVGAVERIARDDLGLVKKQEIVFKIEGPTR